MREFRLGMVLLVAFAAIAVAQPSPLAPTTPLPLGETLLNIPTPRTLARHSWEVRFTHRFSQPINDGDIHSFWGLDSSADIGIALSWAATNHLQFTLFRTDLLDDYELAAKWLVVEEARAVPFGLALRGGVDYRSEENLERRSSWFAQAILAKRIGRRLELFIAPSVVTDAPIDQGSYFRTAYNVPVGAAWLLRPELSLVAEVIPENGDLPDGFDSALGWALGLKRAIGGHFFEIILTNSRATHVDQMLTSSLLGTGLEAGDVHLGFNIVRRFGED